MPIRRNLPQLGWLLDAARPHGSSAEALHRWQSTQLRRLARYAARYSPHYARVFREAGITPDELSRPADLTKLPVLDAVFLREHTREVLSTEVDQARCRWRHTSGTIRRALRFPRTRFECLMESLLWLRGYRRFGLRPWHRQAKLVPAYSRLPTPYLLQRLGLFRRIYSPSMALSFDLVTWLRTVRPTALFAWGGTLDTLARELEDRDEHLPVPLVFSSSVMLLPDMRQRIAERFEADVVDAYGAVETGPLAWQCPDGGFHVAARNAIVEITDEEGRPARRGRIVVTVLWQRALPLIRYAIGDLAEWADTPCSCRSPYPRIGSLHGREQTLVRLPNGRWLSPGILEISAAKTPGVRRYRLVELDAGRLLLQVERSPDAPADLVRRVADHVRPVMTDGIELRVHVTARLSDPPELKFLPTVSRRMLDQLRAQGRDIRALLEGQDAPGVPCSRV